jgi:MFS family permease
MMITAHAHNLYNGSFLVGMMAGPVVGGALSGISLRAPLLIYGFLLIGASTSGAVLLRNSTLAAKPTASQERETITIKSALALSPYRSALIISFYYIMGSLRYEPLDSAALYGRRD